jgi:hypothetical protein
VFKNARCEGKAIAPGARPTGVGPYGHQDLVGNLWEWTADYYEPGAYALASTTDPTGPLEGHVHTVRGGCWNSFLTNTRVTNRFQPMIANQALGVRCVRTTTEPNPTKMSGDLEPGRVDWARSGRGDLVTLTGQVSANDGELLVSVFDDAGQLWMGHSPVAEIKRELRFGTNWELTVPAGTYLVEVITVGPQGFSSGRVEVAATQDGRVTVPMSSAGAGAPGPPPGAPPRAPSPPR